MVDSDVPRQETCRAVPWRGVLAVLVAGSLVLVAASWVTLELVPHPYFAVGGGGHAYLNVGVEGNLPTWWTLVLLLVATVGSLAVGMLTRAAGAGSGLPWLFVGALLLVLSLDEDTSLHERLHRPARLIASPEEVPFVWLVLGVPLAAAVLLAVVLVARRLPRESRTMLIAGLAVFFGGAVGLEAVASQLHAAGLGESSWLVAAYHLEELLEMLGVAVVAVAPLRALRLRRLHGDVVLTVRRPQSPG